MNALNKNSHNAPTSYFMSYLPSVHIPQITHCHQERHYAALIHSNRSAAENCRRLCDVITAALTPSEVWRVVVDIGKLHGDCRSARQSAQMPSHVFGLENYQIFIPTLPVHVRDRGAEDAW